MNGLILDLCLLLLSVRGIGVSCAVVGTASSQHQEWQSLNLPLTPPLHRRSTQSLHEAGLGPDVRWMKQNEVKHTHTDTDRALSQAETFKPDTRPVSEYEAKKTDRTMFSEQASAGGLLSPCMLKSVHKHSPVFSLHLNHNNRFSHSITEQQIHVPTLTYRIKNSLHKHRRKRTDGSIPKQISMSNFHMKRTAKRKNGVSSKKKKQIHDRNNQKKAVKGSKTEANENYSADESSTHKPEEQTTNRKRTTELNVYNKHSVNSEHRTRVIQAEKTATGSTTPVTSFITRNFAHLGSSHTDSSESQQYAAREWPRQRKAWSTVGAGTVGGEEDASIGRLGGKQSSHSQKQHTLSLTTTDSDVGSDIALGLDGESVNKTALLAILRSREQERRLQYDGMLAYVCVVVLVLMMMLCLWCLGGMDACRYRPDQAVPFSDMQPLITLKDLLKSRRNYDLLYNDPEEWEEVVVCHRGSDA